MQQLSTTKTAALLLAMVVVTAGCGDRVTGSVGSPNDRGPATEATTATSAPSTTIADAASSAKPAESAGTEATPSISSTSTTTTTTTTPTVATAPELGVEDIDSVLDGLDDTLAELDQALNQAAAAMAAEEGDIIP